MSDPDYLVLQYSNFFILLVFEIRDFSRSLLLKSMLSISRDSISSGILWRINKVNYKELFIIFGLYLAQG